MSKMFISRQNEIYLILSMWPFYSWTIQQYTCTLCYCSIQTWQHENQWTIINLHNILVLCGFYPIILLSGFALY